MAMSASSGEGEVMVEMNTTPLIDVMLVLLTLLIITLPIQTHAVKLDMPRPNQKPPETPPQVVTLVVDFDGTVYWNNQQADQPEIHLQPNRLAKYNTVAMVLADAQRIGVTHIGFTGIETMQ